MVIDWMACSDIFCAVSGRVRWSVLRPSACKRTLFPNRLKISH